MKNKIRLFPLYCCKKILRLDEDVFSADGKLDFHCTKHEQAVITYLTWRGGLTEEAFKQAKKKKEDENGLKLKNRKSS